MRLFLNGNYIHSKKYQESPIDEYKIIVKSGNRERTVIDVNKRTLTKLRDDITKILEAEK